MNTPNLKRSNTTKEYLNQLRKEYIAATPTVSADDAWLRLEQKLENRSFFAYSRNRLWAYVMAITFLLVSGSALVAAGQAKPGEPLYALKQIAAPLVTALSGDKDQKGMPEPVKIRDEIKSKETLYPVPSPVKVERQEQLRESGEDKQKEASASANPEQKPDEQVKKDTDKDDDRQVLGEQNNTEVVSDEDNKKSRNKSNGKNRKWYNWMIFRTEP